MAQARRDEQKLWLILFQIKAIRARLNSLAVQRGLFWTLALMIGAAAGIVGAAMDLAPLAFLTIAAILVLAAAVGSIAAVRSAWRMRTSPARAAAIADERGDLKGRLATIQALAVAGRATSLWPYLVEDTYGARGQFEPARIEPRWFSPAGAALLAAMVFAALLIPGALLERDRQAAVAQAGGMQGSGAVTADISNLDIRPADPALAPNAEIYADAATLNRLRERLAQEPGGGALSKLAGKARNFADAIQSAITGRHPQDQPPVLMRLTDRDAKPGAAGDDGHGKPPSQANTHGGGAANGAATGAKGEPSPTQQPNRTVPDNGLAAASPGTVGGMDGTGAQAGQPPPDSALADDGEGSAHGSGTDPSSLFGSPSPPQLGADSFKIAIDADPSDEASAPGSPGYLPPRVRAPLNPNQYPDEPQARASVPMADQITIKRVFER